jgi:hypothetical protein
VHNNINYDYAKNEMYSRQARLREAQLNGTAYLKPEHKGRRPKWFSWRPGARTAGRYIPAAGTR